MGISLYIDGGCFCYTPTLYLKTLFKERERIIYVGFIGEYCLWGKTSHHLHQTAYQNKSNIAPSPIKVFKPKNFCLNWLIFGFVFEVFSLSVNLSVYFYLFLYSYLFTVSFCFLFFFLPNILMYLIILICLAFLFLFAGDLCIILYVPYCFVYNNVRVCVLY